MLRSKHKINQIKLVRGKSMQESSDFQFDIDHNPETFQLARKIKQEIQSAVLGQTPSLEKSAP